jgi:hypothetical protein
MHKKHRQNVQVRKNAFVDSGDGVIAFPEGQVITDGSVQRNGTRYDIASMDISEYEGQSVPRPVRAVSNASRR